MISRELIRNVAVVLGAIVIIAGCLFTLTHLTDRVILLILVPCTVVGLLLVGIYWATGKSRT